MWYFLFVIIAAAAIAGLSHIRLRLELSGERRLMFIGLGQTGPELDFAQKHGVVRLFGFSIWRFALGSIGDGEEETTGAIKIETIPKEEKEKKEKVVSGKKRERRAKDIVAVIPESGRALWRYFTGLLKAAIVQQAEGEIEAGFDSPDLTGQAFGYYQAALAIAPALVGRVRYIPDWTGASFAGVARITVAMPLYKFTWLTIRMIFSLPLMKIIKLAIGRKKGVTDV